MVFSFFFHNFCERWFLLVIHNEAKTKPKAKFWRHPRLLDQTTTFSSLVFLFSFRLLYLFLPYSSLFRFHVPFPLLSLFYFFPSSSFPPLFFSPFLFISYSFPCFFALFFLPLPFLFLSSSSPFPFHFLSYSSSIFRYTPYSSALAFLLLFCSFPLPLPFPLLSLHKSGRCTKCSSESESRSKLFNERLLRFTSTRGTGQTLAHLDSLCIIDYNCVMLQLCLNLCRDFHEIGQMFVPKGPFAARCRAGFVMSTYLQHFAVAAGIVELSTTRPLTRRKMVVWEWRIYDDLWWFMMIYDDLWWFMMIYDDLWWFMMIYDDLWWFMMIYDDLWFMMIYDDLWLFMMIYDDLWWFMMI